MFRSGLWQTNAILLDGVLVDSLVLPHELRRLPRPEALVVTHAHFDHLLARSVFPDVPLHAGASTIEAIALGEWEDELRESDDELYVERDALPRLDDARPLDPALFDAVVEAGGHTRDGIALLAGDVLLPGDYLIEVEIPLVAQAGSPERYLATLDRLEPLVREARRIVPGHGPELDRDRALALLELDRRYVSHLDSGPTRGPQTARQQRIHSDNVRKHC